MGQRVRVEEDRPSRAQGQQCRVAKKRAWFPSDVANSGRWPFQRRWAQQKSSNTLRTRGGYPSSSWGKWMNVTRAGSFFAETSQFLSSPMSLAKERRAQKGVSWPTCIFLPATAMIAPHNARVNGSTVFGGTVRMNANLREDAFFDAWATLLSEAMAENAWSASFGEASRLKTMGAL